MTKKPTTNKPKSENRKLKTDNLGLTPAIIQDYQTKKIYMLGYMNQEALTKTLQTNLVHFYSRARKKLWLKGETSGNKLKLKEILIDCDNDTLLLQVELLGTNACHTGNLSCFTTPLFPSPFQGEGQGEGK